MTVDEIKNILAMVAEIMETISKYFPADLNQQLIDLLTSVSEGKPLPITGLFDEKVDYSGALKVLKGLDAVYKEAPNIADFATKMENRNLLLKVVSCVI
jgi:hypothetical protein